MFESLKQSSILVNLYSSYIAERLKNLKKIDFAIAGFPRCGTTSLVRNLRTIPNVEIPKYETQIFQLLSRQVILDRDKEIVGIKNTNLVYAKYYLTALIKSNPNIKIIICLRKPSDWLYSFYHYRKFEMAQQRPWVIEKTNSDPRLKSITFENIVLNTAELLRASITNGMFADYLDYYLQIIPANQIFILILEDLAKHPNRVYRQFFDFLGISAPTPTKPIKANAQPSYEDKNSHGYLLEYLDKIYQKNTAELNKLLRENWGIENNCWA